jgi:hypothetical protein
VDLIGAELKWIDKLCEIHLHDKSLIANPVLKSILEFTMGTFNETLNQSSKQDFIKEMTSQMKDKSGDRLLQNSLKLQNTFFPLHQDKHEAVSSPVLRQIEFTSNHENTKLVDSSGQVSKTVLFRSVLPTNTLFNRMMNPSVLFTAIDHQLKSENLVYKKHFWVYPYMADFVLPNSIPQLHKEGKKAPPVALFVADSDSFMVGMSQIPRYLVSQSKLYFKSMGYLVVTVQPDILKLKTTSELVTDLIVSTSQTTINFNN